LRVLVQIAQGLNDEKIAVVLGLSQYTVRSHARRIYQATGAAGRIQAVAWAYEHGLLGAGGDGGRLPGDGLREFAATLRPGVEGLASRNQAWREGYKAGVGASARAAAAKAVELDRAAARAASEVPDA
jgi:DNA-binding CsgD family transcriptional regulator